MQKVLNRLPRLEARTWYILAFVFFMWCKFFATFISNVMVTFVLVPLGIIMLGYDIRKKRISFNAFSLVMVVSLALLALANIKSGDFELNTWARFSAILVFMLIFGIVPQKVDARQAQKERKKATMLFICLMFPFFLLAVISVVIARPIPFPGAEVPIGIWNVGSIVDRVRILAHPNISARIALGCIIFCIYNMYGCSNRWKKAFLIIAIAVFSFGMIHAQSRTCNIMCAIALGAMAFRWAYIRLNGNIRGIIAGLAVCVAIVLIVMSLIGTVYSTNIKIVSVIHPELAENVNTELRGGDGQLDVFDNGRDYIWENGITYLCEHPSNFIIGMGTGDIMEKIVEETEPWLSDAWKPHLHNSYLEALARGGVPLIVCILAFLLLLVKPCVLILTDKDNIKDKGAYLFPILLGILLINGLTEEILFTGIRTFSLFFYFAAGHIMYEYGRMKEAKQAKLIQK